MTSAPLLPNPQPSPAGYSPRRSIWPIAVLPLALVAIMTPIIVLASTGPVNTLASGFDAIVHGIESRYHAHATHIPFAGIISGLANHATHGGVHQLRVANFENFNQPIDGEELNALVTQRIGQGWQRIIRETSRSGGEQTLIFVRPEGNRMGMMILDLDGKELDVVGLSINPDQLAQQINDHTRHHDSDADSDKDSDSGKDSDEDSANKPHAPKEDAPDSPAQPNAN